VDLVFQAALIGLLQGLTEFIPVSSSAHLELFPWLAGWGSTPLINSLAFDVFLHLGTGLALLVYFWRDLVRYLRAWLASIRDRSLAGDPDRRLAWLLLFATVPAAIIGFLGEDLINQVFHAETGTVRLAIAVFLVVGALALWAADHLGRRTRRMAEIDAPSALMIGFSQALALLPGISRSGATISAGLALGMTREAAARFSFLLATPITLGAGLYGSRKMLTETHGSLEWLAIGAGFAAATISGMIAISFLLAWLRHRSVAVFSVYRLAFAVLVVVLVLAGR
jgi:undecaprenyl-diphosphatase